MKTWGAHHDHLSHQPDACHRHRDGAATLLMTVVLMLLSTLIIIFAANYGVMESKSIANLQRNEQAFNAAQAGLEFGIVYLQQNSSAILASTAGGYIQPYSSASTTNVTLANHSKFSIAYTNPTAFNYTLITITATGTSDDGTATRTVSQQVQFGSLLLHQPTVPLTALSTITLGGNAEVINTSTTSTIQTGSTLTISRFGETVLASGVSSTKSNIKSDVSQSNAALAAMTTSSFFNSFFGLPDTMIANTVATHLTNSASTNYNTLLNGKAGTSIQIDQTGGTATIDGSTTIGSSTNPVVLIINGDSAIGGNATIYGFVYLNNTITTSINGNATLAGGLAATGPLHITNGATLTFSPTILTNLQNQISMSYYAKVPGSWKDF